jgi:hypothetical protein
MIGFARSAAPKQAPADLILRFAADHACGVPISALPRSVAEPDQVRSLGRTDAGLPRPRGSEAAEPGAAPERGKPSARSCGSKTATCRTGRVTRDLPTDFLSSPRSDPFGHCDMTPA